METIKIRFNYFYHEMGWLGMMANSAGLLWNEFFNQAVDEKIKWTLDFKNKKTVDAEMLSPVLEEAIEGWEENFKDLVTLSFKFPVKKLGSLDQAANRLYLVRDVFIQTAVFEKINRVEDEIADNTVDGHFDFSEEEETITDEEDFKIKENCAPWKEVFKEIENEGK